MEENTGHGSRELHQRIGQLITDSRDPEFTAYLNQLGSALWSGQIDDGTAASELDKNVNLYRLRMRKEKSRLEFTVGAGVLGVVGAIFLLIAFVIFAMNFMSGFVKGICLYGIAAAVLAVSELFVKKRQETFSFGMTGAGISGLFLTTVINYAYFSVINDIAAVVLTVLITGLAFWISYKRDSGLFRIIALSGCLVCLLPVVDYQNVWQFFIAGVMVLLFQAGAAFMPAKKEQNVTLVFQMVISSLSVVLFSGKAASGNLSAVWISAFVIVMTALLNLLFFKTKMDSVSAAVYFAAGAVNSLCLCVSGLEGWKICLFLFVPLAVVAAVGALMLHHRIYRWLPYWCLLFALYVCYLKSGQWFYSWWIYACVALVFASAKLLAGVRELRISECIITLYTFFYFFGISGKGVGEQYVKLTILAVLFLLSSFCLRYWQAFHKVMITLALAVFALQVCPDVIRLPVVAGIFVSGIFLFSLVDRWRDKSMRFYNIFNLCFLSLCYVRLAFMNQFLIFLIMLCFGVTVLTVCLDDKYALTGKNKYLWIGIFLTYMFLILRPGHRIINSVLLAAAAMFCVGAGFAARQKAARIYGLVLAIISALKMVLIDFYGTEVIFRMLAFLIVGILILIISYIYVRLEKQMIQKDDKEAWR